MVIVYGTRFYGKVRACGRSFLATRFFHIYFVPLIPVGTHLVLQENPDGSFRGIQSAFSFKSMTAGYLRVWGPIALIGAILSGVSTLQDVSDDPFAMIVAGLFTAIVAIALLAGTVLAFAVIGRLSEEEKRQRSVYALHTGFFVDPADLGPARQGMRDGLLATIGERARGLASMGYRGGGGGDIAQLWPQVALDPTHNDDALVTAAFTLARLESSVDGPWKIQMEQLHSHLWQRIVRMNPPYLHAHRQFA